MKPKVTLSIISIAAAVVVFAYLFNNNNTKEVIIKLKNEKVEDAVLKTYYGKILYANLPQFSDSTNHVSFFDTANSLLLYREYNIRFNVNIAVSTMSTLFNNEWRELKKDKPNSEIKTQQIDIAYEYVRVMQKLNQIIPDYEKYQVYSFYLKFIKNLNKYKYINENEKMLIEDRLSYLGNYIYFHGMDTRNVDSSDYYLKKELISNYKKFSLLSLHSSSIEGYMNLLYAISGLEASGNNKQIYGRKKINGIYKLINSKQFGSYDYYDQAIFIDKFIYDYPAAILHHEILQRSNYIMQSFFQDNTTYANSLKYECLNLFYNTRIGYSDTKSYLLDLDHNENYGFYQSRLLIPTYRELFFSVRISQILGLKYNFIRPYVNLDEKLLGTQYLLTSSFEEMYYCYFLNQYEQQDNPSIVALEPEFVSKAREFVSSNDPNENNFVQYYYAIKLILDSGDLQFARKYVNLLDPFITIVEAKYKDNPDINYVVALDQDVLSYYPDYHISQDTLQNEMLNLKNNYFYLDTINKYLNIMYRKKLFMSNYYKIIVKRKLNNYRTNTGFSAEAKSGSTSLSATYYGLSIIATLGAGN